MKRNAVIVQFPVLCNTALNVWQKQAESAVLQDVGCSQRLKSKTVIHRKKPHHCGWRLNMLAFFLAAILSAFVFVRGMSYLMSDALYFSEGEDTAIKVSSCSDDG